MKCFNDTYEYADDVDPKTNQYGIVDFSKIEYVEARYVKHFDPENNGNPCIEALPRPRSLEECTLDYFKPILGYSMSEIQALPSGERIYRLNQLRKLRLPIAFDYMLEVEMHNALIRSYENRYQFYDPEIPVWMAVDRSNGVKFPEQAKNDTCGKYITNKTSSVSGWSLLGGSGTGKSSAIDILKSHYPQVIEHPLTKGNLKQIVFLHVSCPANSNFKVLYSTIGREIDNALSYTTSVYQNLLSNSKDPISTVVQLIQNFCIGIIIFDEIQEIDFAGTKSNTFASLVTIGELSGVAIAVSGLESAYSKMFKKVYTARRVGKVISSNRYCFDKSSLKTLMSLIFSYQWFDKKVSLTDEIVDRFELYTGGRIDQLITLYSYMNYEYLISPENKRPEINGKFVDLCIEKYYGDMRKLLAEATIYHKKNGDFDGRMLEAFEKAKQNLHDLLGDDEQADMAEHLSSQETLQAMNSFANTQSNVVQNVQKLFPQFEISQIIETLKTVYNEPGSSCLDDSVLSGRVIQVLLGTTNSSSLEDTSKKPKIAKKKRPDANLLKQNLLNVYHQQ